MSHRLYCPVLMQTGTELSLPAHAAKHAQVLRLQPGDAVELFHGGLAALQAPLPVAEKAALLQDWHTAQAATHAVNPTHAMDASTGYFQARISHMGRNEVRAHIGQWQAPQPAPACQIHMVCGMPANERMDWLVEKATELGVSSIQPVQTARSVVKLAGERAQKRVAHWQAIAVSACEQSGRTTVPAILPVQDFKHIFKQKPQQATQHMAPSSDDGTDAIRCILSLQDGGATLQSIAQLAAQQLAKRVAPMGSTPKALPLYSLSGPEGGLAPDEEALAMAQGWLPVSLGAYTLRAETAPLAVLAGLAALA